MIDRNAQWLNLSDRMIAYHRNQYDTVYRSTECFCDFLSGLGLLKPDAEERIVDIGAGMGANVFYMERRFPGNRFTGIELNPDLVSQGQNELPARGAVNSVLEQGDLFALDAKHVNSYDGLISYHTIMGFTDFEEPLGHMLALQPRWVGLSSLFYEGNLTCRTEISDYTCQFEDGSYSRHTYSIFSLPRVSDFLRSHGYQHIHVEPFVIDIDLPKPEHGGRGTYTRKMDGGERLQFSGPMLMPWYFIAARRG